MTVRGILLFLILMSLPGCAKSAHQTGQDLLDHLIPADVRAQVDPAVTFGDLRANPGSYVGRTVMVSGIALKAQRVKDHTEIEVMQIPAGDDMAPSDRRSRSEGRFLANKSGEFLDPAVIERGSPLTVVGEVTGSVTRPLDDGEYVYPVLEIKHLVDWSDVRSRERDRGYGSAYGYPGYGYGAGPYSSWYYGYGGPFWGPYGAYPYSFYGPYYPPFVFTQPSPPPPPPSSVPPRFQHSR